MVSIDPDYPMFVLTFCIFHKEIYAESIVPNVLKFKFKYFGHDQIILHEREIRKSKSSFNILLDKSIRDPFFNDMNSLVQESRFLLIASAIKKISLKKHSDPKTPYHIAMAFGLESIFSHLWHLGCREGKTYLIFESRGNKEDAEAELEFRRLCSNNATNRQLPFEIIIADKKSNSSGLQLADLIARPIGIKILRPNQPNRAYDIVEGKFRRGNNGELIIWGLKIFP